MPVTINGTTGEITPATVYSGSSSGSITVQATAVAGTNTLTLPATTDTVVTLAASQTLTNKSIAASQLTGTVSAARLPTGSILQVASTSKTDTFTTTSTTFADLTGMSVSITPSSTSSKILIMVALSMTGDTSTQGYARLMRDSTAIGIGAAYGSRVRASFQQIENQPNECPTAGFTFLDSPSTTSSVTYKIQLQTQGTGTIYVNRSSTWTDSASSGTMCSTITVMEIAG
jgi:hypothetical protein